MAAFRDSFEESAAMLRADEMKPVQFVAVGSNGLRLTSVDGKEWLNAQVGKDGEVYRAVCFGNGRAVAVGTFGGSNIFAAATEPPTWQTATIDGKYVKYLRGLGFGNGQFLGIGGDPGCVGCSNPFVTLSTDGLKWGEFHTIPGKTILRRLAFGNDRFVGVGDRGRRSASKDGKDWQDAPEVKAIDTLVDVAFGNGVFVGVGLHGLRMTSEDGLQWAHRQVGEEGEHLNSIIWASNRFVAIGPGATFTSENGQTWQRHANKNAPLTVAFGNDIFIGANWRGRLLRSTDAIVWEEVHKAEHHLEALCWVPRK